MTVQGPRSGNNAAEKGDPPTGSVFISWADIDKARVDDGDDALCAFFEVGSTARSKWLGVTGYGFTLPVAPSDISVRVRGQGTSNTILSILYQGIQLIVNNSLQGNILAPNTYMQDLFGGGFATLDKTMSGSPTTWGLPGLTFAEINASNFGVAVYFANGVEYTPGSGNQAEVGIDSIEITMTYTAPTGVEMQVTQTISLAAGSATATKAVGQTISLLRTPELSVLQTISLGGTLAITEPDPGDVVTTAAYTFTWQFGPGVQSDIRLRVWDNSSESGDPVYDTGVLGSTLQEHTNPAGALPTGNLWVRVEGHDASGAFARSQLVAFSTSFPTSVNVNGVSLEALGGECDPLQLPGIRVRWNQVTPGPGETFVQYEVWRRESGASAWVRLEVGVLESISTVRFDDFNIKPETVYEYAIVWQATSGASILYSAVQSSLPQLDVEFDFTWLHSTTDPTKQARLDHWDALVDPQQDLEYFLPSGQAAPRAYFGEADYAKVTIPMHEIQRSDRDKWNALRELLDEQRAGEVLCLRLGRDAERYFVTIARPRKQVRQKTYAPTLEMTETDFDEAIQT